MDKKYLELAEAFMKASAGREVPKELSHAEKVGMLKAIAGMEDSANAARKDYIQSRAEVLLPLIREQSTVRSIFTPEVLGAQAQSNYPISFDYTEVASYLPKFGGAITNVVEGDEMYIPTWMVEAGVRYSMDIAEQGRLDIAGQSMNLLKDKIVAKEEYAGWRAIKGALSGYNTNQTVYCSGSSENFHSFSKKAINKMITQMDIQRRSLNDLYVSPRSLADIREWSNSQIDYLTQREIFQAGGLPGNSVWDVRLHKVYNSALVSDAEAFGFDTRSYGKMPIKYELKTYEDPTAILDWQVGVIARENIGFGITDSWAVVKAVMDSTHVGTACSVV